MKVSRNYQINNKDLPTRESGLYQKSSLKVEGKQKESITDVLDNPILDTRNLLKRQNLGFFFFKSAKQKYIKKNKKK